MYLKLQDQEILQKFRREVVKCHGLNYCAVEFLDKHVSGRGTVTAGMKFEGTLGDFKFSKTVDKAS